MISKPMIWIFLLTTLSLTIEAACPYATGRQIKIRPCGTPCCTKQIWDVYTRPELNPPDDIATLPEREQRKFVKMFDLVPKTIKAKSSQHYAGRMVFKRSPQFAAIMKKLTARLARSGKMLAEEPSVTANEVLKMCNDTIVYGRSLIMGRFNFVSMSDLAEKYRFKKAEQIIKELEDNKHFRKGLVSGYPHDDPECRDFAVLAKTVNQAQWNTFISRVEMLKAKNVAIKKNIAGPVVSVTKKQMYDEYDNALNDRLPNDIRTLSRKEQARLSKIYDFIPVQIRSMAGREYNQRIAYLKSPQYIEIKKNLSARIPNVSRHLSLDPMVKPAEIYSACDEMIRYGRPLVFGDMRDVSLVQLARTYKYENVEKFVELVEAEKNARTGFAGKYPSKNPEFADFAKLAGRAYPQRWKEFLYRLSLLNRTAKEVAASRRVKK